MADPSVAEQLHDYMAWRAAHAKIAYDLTPAFFQSAIDEGITEFFGVTVDDKGIVSDSQQPWLLARYWKEMADEYETDAPAAATLRTLRRLARETHLVATIDLDGAPYHHVVKVTQHSEQPGTFILWLAPQGVDHDLVTPMPPILSEAADDE